MPPVSRFRRRPKQPGETFEVPINRHKGPPPPPEVLPWWWTPDRDGAQPPPEAFAKQLADIDPDLRVCFSPVHERWLVWAKNPRVQNLISRGWSLLYIWEHPVTHEFLPLNELIFHNIYLIARDRYPQAKVYFDRINADVEKVKAAREATHQDERKVTQKEFLDGLKINSAGRGNKSALHDSDNMSCSPGEAAWRAETRKARLPSAFIKQEQADREKQFYSE